MSRDPLSTTRCLNFIHASVKALRDGRHLSDEDIQSVHAARGALKKVTQGATPELSDAQGQAVALVDGPWVVRCGLGGMRYTARYDADGFTVHVNSPTLDGLLDGIAIVAVERERVAA